MKHLRLPRIAIFSTLLVVVLVVLLHRWGKESEVSSEAIDRIDSLEAKASFRFGVMRGMTPCDANGERWISVADRILRLSEQKTPQTLIVVAPTFSDIRVLALNPDEMLRYRFTGQTAFRGVFFDVDSVRATRLPAVELEPSDMDRLNAAVLRNSKFAASVRASGAKDGVGYFVRYGSAYCAAASSPEPGTLRGQFAALADELLTDRPSSAGIRHAINELEKLELSH